MQMPGRKAARRRCSTRGRVIATAVLL